MKSAFAVLPAILLAACASQGPDSMIGTEKKSQDRQRIQLKRTSDCVFQRNIEDFNALDNDHVVLFTGGRRKAYLVQLTGACFDVRSQNTLAAIDGDQNGQICGFGRDSIAYRNMGTTENCRILGIEDLSDERRAALGISLPPAPKPKKEDKAEDESPSPSPK
jgi:hypothetical protein